MTEKKNNTKKIVYAIVFSILTVVIFIGLVNGKEAQRKGYFVDVKPLDYHVSNTTSRSVSFEFEFESKKFESWISYNDYKKIKNLEEVKMFYFDKRESFDLNTVPNLNAKLGIFDYLLILLPILGVIYNLYILKRKHISC